MNSYGMNTQEGGAMCQMFDECAQTLATTHRGGVLVEIPIAFNWYVGGNSPAIGSGVCCTLQCSNATCPAVVIWEG